MNFKDSKYNTNKSASFVGYCDLPCYKSEGFRRFVECCGEICKEFELGDNNG